MLSAAPLTGPKGFVNPPTPCCAQGCNVNFFADAISYADSKANQCFVNLSRGTALAEHQGDEVLGYPPATHED